MAPELRASALQRTRPAAAAFLEDMQHIREVLGRQGKSRGELRLLSNVLRRLLVHRDLITIATPRTGRIALVVPDNNPIYKALDGQEAFFSTGRVTVFGIYFGATLVQASPARKIRALDPGRTVALKFESFLRQRVLYVKGHWATREDVVKYVANVASGVHSGALRNEIERALEHARAVASYRMIGNAAAFMFDEDAASAHLSSEPTFGYTPDTVDVVLVELLATAQALTDAPDVTALESAIAAELASHTA